MLRTSTQAEEPWSKLGAHFAPSTLQEACLALAVFLAQQRNPVVLGAPPNLAPHHTPLMLSHFKKVVIGDSAVRMSG